MTEQTSERAVGCRHAAWGDTSHCAEMSCPNYINKCTDYNAHAHGLEVNAQAFPDKVYFQYTDLDRGELDLQQNCAISYEQAADLWQRLREAWMTQTRKEFIHCRIEEAERGDAFEGMLIVSTFNDLGMTTLRFDNEGFLTCPNDTMLELMRPIR